VERVFALTFGYPLAIDPLTYEGVCVRKSNRNYVKDAVVVSCPVPAAAVAGEGDPVISLWGRPVPAATVDGQYVYERLVDSRVPDLGTVELRAFVVRGQVVVARRRILRDWISTGSFEEEQLDHTLVYLDSVFSRQEREHIAAFCDALGLDFGALDIIRDNVDGRVYLLDANKTPGTLQLDRTTDLMNTAILGLLAQAFVERYPPRVKVRGRDNRLFARPLRHLRPRRFCG
jgi:hypothetical protein